MTALPPEPGGKRATRLSDGLTLEEEWLELGARSWSCRAWLICIVGRKAEMSEPPQTFVANWSQRLARHRL